jgi:hypothetical protein
MCTVTNSLCHENKEIQRCNYHLPKQDPVPLQQFLFDTFICEGKNNQLDYYVLKGVKI